MVFSQKRQTHKSNHEELVYYANDSDVLSSNKFWIDIFEDLTFSRQFR